MPIKAVLTFNDGSISVHSSNIKKTSEIFDSGFYRSVKTDNGLLINSVTLGETNDPFDLDIFHDIVDYSSKFFNPELKDKVNKMGFKHKLGILLYGIQGTGKTTFLYFLARKIVSELNGICFVCQSAKELAGAVSLAYSIREVQDNPIVFIGDEFERWARDMESEMKSFLDGENSIDNTVFLAATNYIDKVPDSLKSRPSRFKGVYEIKKIKNRDIIYNIIKSKSEIIELFSDEEIGKISDDLAKNGVTLDEIKQRILDGVLNSSLGMSERSTIGFKPKEEEDADTGSTTSWTMLYSNPTNSPTVDTDIFKEKEEKE